MDLIFNCLLLTPMKWGKKISLGKQDLQDLWDIFGLRQDTSLWPKAQYPDDLVNPV
jgi:hypothetical protein